MAIHQRLTEKRGLSEPVNGSQILKGMEKMCGEIRWKWHNKDVHKR
jgi:hypothetical protein